MRLYGDMSSRVMRILEQFSPDVEVYSIDEAFLKLNGFDAYDLHTYGTEMRQRILNGRAFLPVLELHPPRL